MKLDHHDFQIIHLLKEDGRMPIAEIARNVAGISERVVLYRLERLLKNKVIQISAIPNPKVLGFPVTSEVSIRVEPGQIETVADKLSENERVTYLDCVLGNFDIGILLIAKDNAELYTIVSSEISNISGVIETSIAPTPLSFKFVNQWNIPAVDLPEDIQPKVISHFPPDAEAAKIDAIDREIIHLLMEDGRLAYSEIARRISGISSKVAREKIERLYREHVIFVSTIIDHEKAGYPIKANIHLLVEPNHVVENAHRLAAINETSYVAASIGDSDLSVQVYTKNVKELEFFVTNVVHKIPGVKRTNTFLVTRVLKGILEWRIPEYVIAEERRE